MLNETEKDRTAEAGIAAVLCEEWKLEEALKLSMGYGVDYALVNMHPKGSITSYAEIKDRELEFNYGDGYYIALKKAMMARLLTAQTGCRCYLVVSFFGSIHVADFEVTVKSRVIKAGRKDRLPAQPFDIEPHCVIDWKHFKLLGT
jgi:hypothetical protein